MTEVLPVYVSDLDDLHDWKMGILEKEEIGKLADQRLLETRDGTEIIWSRCDRLSEFGAVKSRGFNDLVAHANPWRTGWSSVSAPR